MRSDPCPTVTDGTPDAPASPPVAAVMGGPLPASTPGLVHVEGECQACSGEGEIVGPLGRLGWSGGVMVIPPTCKACGGEGIRGWDLPLGDGPPNSERDSDAARALAPACHAVPAAANAERRTLRSPEVNEILGAFADMLAGPTGDGARKRDAGTKPFWKVDTSHPAAAGRHRAKYAAGERYDAESGAHHLVHSAWRDLATAYQEMVDDGLIPGEVPS